MLDGFSLGVHFVDVNSRDPRVVRVTVEQVQKIHARPHVVAHGDDFVNDDTRARAFLGDFVEEFSQGAWTVRNEQRQRIIFSLSPPTRRLAASR
jgi:hypothetical protein